MKETPMDKKAASRILSANDKSGKNQEFAIRFHRVAEQDRK